MVIWFSKNRELVTFSVMPAEVSQLAYTVEVEA
jgi:hypothetical protein